MTDRSSRMPRRENDDQTPINLEGIAFIPVERIDVAEFHELPDGEGAATAVHLILQLGEQDDDVPPLIARIKSRDTCDRLITALIAHSKAVWPDEPLACSGFDPDAICKCGRRIEDHKKQV